MPLRLALPVRETVAGHRLANPTSAPSNASVGRGRGLAQGLGIRLFAFGGAYWPLSTAHSDPLWARTCFGCEQSPRMTCPQGGGGLVAEETCLEKFSTANSGAIFPITFNDCGGIFPILCFGHQVQNLYPVLARGGGGMIGGGGCRIKYVMWMDGLLRMCVVCLAAVNTAAMNTRLYPSGHFRLPTTCSCQLIVSAVSTDIVFSVFSVGRCSAKAAAVQGTVWT